MKDWLDKLAESSGPQSEEPPKGFYSAKEIAKRVGYKTRNNAARWMKQEIAAGRVREIKVRRRTRSGSIAIVPYYGPSIGK